MLSKVDYREQDQRNSSCITDVASFFRDITAEYIELEQNILKVTNAFDSCSSEQILQYCDTLGLEREKLARMDQQLFDILDLAGGELGDDPMVHRCYLACKRANSACSTLYHKLLSYKKTLQ